MRLLLFATLLSQTFAVISEEEVGITVRVEPGTSECFFHTVTKEQAGTLEVNYIVLKGGDLDISFELRNPSQRVLAADYRKMSGRHAVEFSNPENHLGDYVMCFDNKFSMQTPKIVALHLYLMDRDGNFMNDMNKLDGQYEGSLEARVEFFESSTGRIKSNLNSIESDQQNRRHVEYIDRTLAETNFENINFWGIVNTMVMMFSGFIQVFLIRSILSDDSKVGRLLRRGKISD